MEAYSAIIESKTDAIDDGSMKRELPLLTHGGNAELLSNELDYEEMVILSGLFRRWALYDTTYSPDFRTELIGYSADLEQLAQWAGEGWRAADPSGAFLCPRCLSEGPANAAALSSWSTRSTGSAEPCHRMIYY